MGFLSNVLSGVKKIGGIVGDFIDSPLGQFTGKIGGDLLSNALNRNVTDKTNRANADLQREFAQNSIQWRVQDAKNAGIHPLYALGASTISASPSFVGAPSQLDFGSAFRAVADSRYNRALQEQTLRKNDLELQNLELQNAGLQADLSSKMGQSMISPALSAVPLSNVKSKHDIKQVGSTADEITGRYQINFLDQEHNHAVFDPANEFADRVSEGVVLPVTEYIRDFDPSVIAKREYELDKFHPRAGKRWVAYSDRSGLVPFVHYRAVPISQVSEFLKNNQSKFSKFFNMLPPVALYRKFRERS